MSLKRKISKSFSALDGIFTKQKISFFDSSVDFMSLTVEELENLLSAGIDPNERDKLGRTPLMYLASCNGDPEVIRTIIKAGAKINDVDQEGKTALIMAARYNSRTDIVEALLDSGADVNQCSRKKRTPLMYAALSNTNLEVIKLLLARGADGSIKDVRRFTAFDHLKKGYNETLRQTEAFTLLKAAAKKQHFDNGK
jgi:ankyrin repeat protein